MLGGSNFEIGVRSMQSCFLVSNKETQIAGYLEHRSILKVVEEHRSLSEINTEKLNIVDVDKFVYINYPVVDGDLAFRSDMNNLRTLLSSAFFHITEAIFIFVDSSNPLMEDFVYSAIRDSTLTRDKVEIVQHSGSLMLPDVGKYLSGGAIGQTTSSSYRDVYVREADSEERDRYMNVRSGLDAVLPVLTDMSALYSQRSSVEAISASRIVDEKVTRPQIIKDFSREKVSHVKTVDSIVVSGDKWADPQLAVQYLSNYCELVGHRVIIVNLSPGVSFMELVQNAELIDILSIKSTVTPESMVGILYGRIDQFGYIVEFLHNIQGVDLYVFYCDGEDVSMVSTLSKQLSESARTIYITHYNERAVRDFLDLGLKCSTVFLNFDKLKEEFKLSAYKEQFTGTTVAVFPTEDVDYTEFYNLVAGGAEDD